MTRFLFALILATAAAWTNCCFAQNAALVIIDMQRYFSTRMKVQSEPDNALKLEQVLERQGQLIEMAKANGMPIVVVEYSDCGPTCRYIKTALGNYPNVFKFRKDTDGMFQRNSGMTPELRQFLDKNNITDLIVSGANGGACVRRSIEGALKKGYRIWTDAYAIADFNCKKFIYPYHFKPRQLKLDSQLRRNFTQTDDIAELDELFDFDFTRCEQRLKERYAR